MSRFHFSRLFREELGKAPYQYLLQLRLERAAELLRGGDGATETAVRVGLPDPSRFATAFRRRFGFAPAEYARRTGPRRTYARIAHDSLGGAHESPSARATG